MNTFLPCPDFSESAQVLDDARLVKQKLEVYQILRTNLGKSEGWKNHPAVKMWKGYEFALAEYGLAIVKECDNRRFSTDYSGEFTLIRNDIFYKLGNTSKPFWFGDSRLHLSHRSRLLFKGRVDATCYSIRKALGLVSINEWLQANGYPLKNVFKQEHIIKLEKFASDSGIEIWENHYRQFGWTEPDTLPYFWPK